jgi:hypothetical protein
MSRKPTWKRTRPKPKAVLRLPDLDQAKSALSAFADKPEVIAPKWG